MCVSNSARRFHPDLVFAHCGNPGDRLIAIPADRCARHYEIYDTNPEFQRNDFLEVHAAGLQFVYK